MRFSIASASIAAASVVVLGLSALAFAQSRTIKVESNDGKYHHVNVAHRGSVRLVRQLSDKRCVEGSTWGTDRTGIWVKGGCRGEFAVYTGTGNGQWDDRNNRWDDRRVDDRRGEGRRDSRRGNWNDRNFVVKKIKVESEGGKRKTKEVKGLIEARLVKRLSDNPCREGYSWGFGRGRIWADHGCRGEFEYTRRR